MAASEPTFDESSDSGFDSEDTNVVRGTIGVDVLVDGKEVGKAIESIEFIEQAFEHYKLAVTFSPDLETMENAVSDPADAANFLKMIGKSIVVKLKIEEEYAVAGAEQRQFQGTVFDVSFDFRSSFVCKITLHGIGNTFKLDQAAYNAIHLKKKRCDIAQSVIQEAGMNANVKKGGSSEDYIVCYNETRWDFLKRYARSEGHWLYADADKVVIDSPTSGKDFKLMWGKDLGSMHARAMTRGNQVTVHGWDYMKKQEIVGKSSSSTEISSVAKEGAREAKKGLFAESSQQDIRLRGLATKDQLTTAAKAKMEGNLSRLAECRGQSNVAGLKVGETVEISGSGAAWNGKYLVTKVEHRVAAGGYYNYFNALPIDVAHPEWQDPNPPIEGFLTGIVTDLNDPEKLGRVKVKFPTLYSNSTPFETDWARLTSPYAGDQRGIFFLPEVNDEVLVCFEHGDIQRPVVMGSFWNGKDKPSMAGAADAAEDNDIKTIFTRSGHQITFSDKKGEEKISIIDKSGGNLIIIDTKEQKISIVSDKDVAVEAKKDITLKADGDVNISGKNVNLKAQQGFKAEGMQTDVKGSSTLNLETSGQGKLKSGMLDIDGGTMCNVKGALIKLN